jgi:hypothetical protein
MIDLKQIEKDLESTGQAIGEVIDKLDLPNEIKEILAQKAVELVDKPEELKEYAINLLSAYLQNKIIEEDPEYQKKVAEIDQKTQKKIEKILNK